MRCGTCFTEFRVPLEPDDYWDGKETWRAAQVSFWRCQRGESPVVVGSASKLERSRHGGRKKARRKDGGTILRKRCTEDQETWRGPPRVRCLVLVNRARYSDREIIKMCGLSRRARIERGYQLLPRRSDSARDHDCTTTNSATDSALPPFLSFLISSYPYVFQVP